MLRSHRMRSATGAAVLMSFAVFASSHAHAACTAPAAATPESIAGIKANPGLLIQNNSNGSAGLVTAVRNLAASDGSTVQPILGLVSGLTGDSVSSIGTGLAQAAALCVRTDTDAAITIQEAVIATNNEALITAFRAAVGDVRTAAVGPAAAGTSVGAGGGLGGSGILSGPTTVANARPFGTSTSSLFANPGASFPTIGSSFTLSTNNSRTFQVISSSVSPTR